jgi:hypothetical protein
LFIVFLIEVEGGTHPQAFGNPKRYHPGVSGAMVLETHQPNRDGRLGVVPDLVEEDPRWVNLYSEDVHPNPILS